MKCRAITIIAAGLVSVFVSTPERAWGAIAINDLYSTGVDAFGSLLADTAPDPHYTLVIIPYPPGPPVPAYAYANPPSGQIQGVYNVYNNSWVLDTGTSQWIGPTPFVNVQFSPQYDGFYVYRTTFTLPASWASVNIAGNWATDNGAYIFLNGVDTGAVKGPNGYATLDPFTLPGETIFVPGVNVLEFWVHNDPYATNFNPTGLQVQITAANYTLAPVPEPTSVAVWSLLGLTIGGVNWRRRK